MFGYATQRDRRARCRCRSRSRTSSPSAWRTSARPATLAYLRPDGKTQVTVRYEDGRPIEIEKLLISTQHGEDGAQSLIRDDLWEHVVEPILPDEPLRRRKLRENFLVNPTGRFVIGGPVGDCGPDRAQDHRRHLRRHGPPRRRRVLGQGPVEGRPLRRLRGPLRRQERRRGRPGRPRRGPGRLRDRRRASGVGDGRDVRDREGRPRARSPSSSTSTSTCARAPSASTSTCTGRSTRRPRPTATSAARTTTSPGRRPTRPTRCAPTPACERGALRPRRRPRRPRRGPRRPGPHARRALSRRGRRRAAERRRTSAPERGQRSARRRRSRRSGRCARDGSRRRSPTGLAATEDAGATVRWPRVPGLAAAA